MPVVDIRKVRPAFYDRRAAADLYYRISDTATMEDLNITSGVNADGLTFIGVFAEERARYQIVVTEDGETKLTRDFIPVDNFDRFAPEGQVVMAFFTEHVTEFIEYANLDRTARERTREEVTQSVTGIRRAS